MAITIPPASAIVPIQLTTNQYFNNAGSLSAIATFEEIITLEANQNAALNQANANDNSNNNSTFGNSSLLNLSPQAIEVLNGFNTNQTPLNQSQTQLSQQTAQAAQTLANLSATQLQQVADVVAASASAPVPATPADVTQTPAVPAINTALSSSSTVINPEQLAYQTMMITQEYMALPPSYNFDGEFAFNDAFSYDAMDA